MRKFDMENANNSAVLGQKGGGGSTHKRMNSMTRTGIGFEIGSPKISPKVISKGEASGGLLETQAKLNEIAFY